MPLANGELVTWLILFLNPLFGNLIEFLINNVLKFQYLSQLRSKKIQITFIKSYLLRAFQQYQGHTQIPS
jgi:hypothetical protein